MTTPLFLAALTALVVGLYLCGYLAAGFERVGTARPDPQFIEDLTEVAGDCRLGVLADEQN